MGTGMALFFDRRVHRISRRSLDYSFVQDAAVDVEAFFRERIVRLSSRYIAEIGFSAWGTSVRQSTGGGLFLYALCYCEHVFCGCEMCVVSSFFFSFAAFIGCVVPSFFPYGTSSGLL